MGTIRNRGGYLNGTSRILVFVNRLHLDILSERKFAYPETKPDHSAGLPVNQQTECSLHHAMAAQDFLQLVVRYSRNGSIVGTNLVSVATSV